MVDNYLWIHIFALKQNLLENLYPTEVCLNYRFVQLVKILIDNLFDVTIDRSIILNSLADNYVMQG